jgi:hypothetical protein
MGPRVLRQVFAVCGLMALAACGGNNNSSPTSPGGNSSGGTTTGTLSAADQADIATLTSNAYSKWFSGIGTALTQTGGTGSVALTTQTITCSGGGTTVVGGTFTNTLSPTTGNGSLTFNVTTTFNNCKGTIETLTGSTSIGASFTYTNFVPGPTTATDNGTVGYSGADGSGSATLACSYTVNSSGGITASSGTVNFSNGSSASCSAFS